MSQESNQRRFKSGRPDSVYIYPGNSLSVAGVFRWTNKSDRAGKWRTGCSHLAAHRAANCTACPVPLELYRQSGSVCSHYPGREHPACMDSYGRHTVARSCSLCTCAASCPPKKQFVSVVVVLAPLRVAHERYFLEYTGL